MTEARRTSEANARTEVQRQRAEVAEARPGWYWWLIMIATVLTASGASLLVSVKNTERSERKLCAIVTLMDDTYRATPPKTATGISMAASTADLKRQLGCPNKE